LKHLSILIPQPAPADNLFPGMLFKNNPHLEFISVQFEDVVYPLFGDSFLQQLSEFCPNLRHLSVVEGFQKINLKFVNQIFLNNKIEYVDITTFEDDEKVYLKINGEMNKVVSIGVPTDFRDNLYINQFIKSCGRNFTDFLITDAFLTDADFVLLASQNPNLNNVTFWRCEGNFSEGVKYLISKCQNLKLCKINGVDQLTTNEVVE
jgi:hypothetical protein